ncbi:FHA domain-containing protein [Pseudoalteromonas fenneropenaei]|uniref:FHA domain-containing protein n=1 Tax=Pseudoalteromonas fenneropenaei TaxID=1737459 RepID=A0ABV7CQG3_9GAMM
MAYLIDEQKLEKIYLKSYHTIGRQKMSVDTVLEAPTVSRHHAVIELNDHKWQIRDLSTNGVWLNDRKLDKNLPYELSINDKIDFAAPGENSFVVANLDEHSRFLISQGLKKQVINVSDQLLLPDENNPEYILFFDKIMNYWFIENLTNSDRQALFDGALISLFGEQWLFYASNASKPTEEMLQPEQVAPCTLQFSVSQDEENTQLIVTLDAKEYDLGTRSHHYLLLLLARIRIEDKHNGLELNQQGWQYREDLAKSLGIQMNHMNIMLHRARKQLADLTEQGAPDLSFLLESYFGKIRLNCQNLTIMKGSNLETRMTF